MPLTAKGKKLKEKFKKQYGKKKGESVFYAMENSGKLKKVIKRRGGGADMGKEKGTETGRPGRSDRDIANRMAQTKQAAINKNKSFKDTGNKQVTVNKPPKVFNPTPLGVFTPPSIRFGLMGLNTLRTSIYNQKNLKEQKKVDVLGGEMLTTGKKGPPTPKGDGNTKVQPPITPVQPIQATKPVDELLVKPKDNFFNFVAYKVGGLSGGVSYGPPPKRGPNSQVPPVKMKKGGYKK